MYEDNFYNLTCQYSSRMFPVHQVNKVSECPFKCGSLFINHEDAAKNNRLEMVIHTNKKPKWHVIQVGPVSGVESNHITEMCIIQPIFTITPYYCFHPAFTVYLHTNFEVRICGTHILKYTRGFGHIISDGIMSYGCTQSSQCLLPKRHA